MTARLFIAVPLPDDVSRLLADAAAQSLAACRARVAPSRELHVTVRFLGDVDAAKVAAIAAAAAPAAAGVPAFAFAVDRLVLGPPGGPPRMLWAELGPEPRFDALCAAVRAATDAVLPGIADRHPPTPHVTLARINVADCGKLAALPSAPPLRSFEARECVLFESRLSPGGPRYERLETFPLGPARA